MSPGLNGKKFGVKQRLSAFPGNNGSDDQSAKAV